MIYNLLVDLTDIASAIAHAFRWLFGLISVIIYDLIVVMYDLFEYLARAEIINNDFVQKIYTKVGFLLGLFMIFKLIFSLIQALIQPEKLTDKKSGYTNILIRCVISIVLLGITPFLFREAFNLQNLLIGSGSNSDNVLYKLIIGDADVDSSSFGRVIATEAYFAFYTDNEYPFLANYTDTNDSDVDFFDNKIDEIKKSIRLGEVDGTGNVRNFSYANSFLNLDVNKQYVVEFNELLSVIVGGIILWMLVMYCLQVATRVFQLAYLQLIAPVPILSYISDPDGAFKKWIQQCISTFLDLFIRLAVIYFVIYFSSYLVELFNDKNSILMSSTGINPDDFWMMTLLEIALLIGLLQFANKLPGLLKEVFPSLGGAGKFDFGLKPSKQAKGVFGFAAGGVAGAAVGLIGGHGVGGRLKGFAGGLTKGAISGAKGKKISEITAARAAQNRKNRKMIEDGSTFGGRIDAKFRDTFGLKTVTEEIDEQIKAIDKENERIDNTEIRTRRDRIDSINNGRIRTIDDAISKLNDSKPYRDKKINDTVITASNAIMDKAKEELMKSNAAVIGATARLDYLEKHHGEVDKLTGKIIDGTMISTQKSDLKSIIDRESEVWVNSNLDNETVARNRQIIANQTGVKLSDVANFSDISTAKSTAKDNNEKSATVIAQIENKIQELNDEKKTHQKTIETLNREISTFEEQKTANNRRKEPLEKSKKKPQADIDAIK